MKNEGSFLYVTGEFGWMTLAPAAYFAVDVFFFIGGFLSCVLMEEKFRKTSNLKT
jgi:peptidoglycan/LPS O-acetylase OafA/YrhL